MTRADGVIPASDTNIVDGLPVYNACVVIKGSYSSRADAQNYKGQFPKVLVEGHIDVVNPEKLPKSGDPSIRIKLQPYAQPVVATPEELAAIPDELSFDARGRIVENDKYATASKIFANAKEAEAGGGVRIYVPGYGDMMPSTSNAFVLAAAMKKHNIKPVYDIWICGTAGEEGKGNLAGMKQLYGFDQKAGTGSNPLNFVANFGLEGGGTVNFLGSYRFEMKFKAPRPAEAGRSKRARGDGRGNRDDCRRQDAVGAPARRAAHHLHRRPRELRATAGRQHGRAKLLARGRHAFAAHGTAQRDSPDDRAHVPGRRDGGERQAWAQGRRPRRDHPGADVVRLAAGVRRRQRRQRGCARGSSVGHPAGGSHVADGRHGIRQPERQRAGQHRHPDLSIQPGVLGRRRRRTCVLGVGHSRRACDRGGPHASRAHGSVDCVGVPRGGRHRRATSHRPDGQADARSRSITLEHPIMKRLIYSLAFVVSVAAGTPAFAQQSGGLTRRVPGTWGP